MRVSINKTGHFLFSIFISLYSLSLIPFSTISVLFFVASSAIEILLLHHLFAFFPQLLSPFLISFCVFIHSMFSSILSIAKASVKLFVSCNKLPSKYSYFRIQFCVMMQNLFTFLMLLLLIFTHCTRKNLFSAGVASESSGADSCWMDRFSLLTWTLRANFLHLGLGDT